MPPQMLRTRKLKSRENGLALTPETAQAKNENAVQRLDTKSSRTNIITMGDYIHLSGSVPARVTLTKLLRCAITVASGEVLAALLLTGAVLLFRNEPLFVTVRQTRWTGWVYLGLGLYMLANFALTLRCLLFSSARRSGCSLPA